MEAEASFCRSLTAQTEDALSRGASRILFWGYNPACIQVLTSLLERGMSRELVAGIVDERTTIQGRRLHDFSIVAPEAILNKDIDTLVVTSNREKEEALRGFIKVHSTFPRVILAGLSHLAFDDEAGIEEVLTTCLVKSYATGYPLSLTHLYQAIQYLGARGVKGDVAEFGICKGGTVIFIRKVLEKFGLSESQVYGFDIFEGFPKAKSVLDLYRHPKCEFKDHLTVIDYCQRFGVEVIKGDICETFEELRGKPLILSFFDTDNYSPTRAALELCAEQTVPGGILFFDHYTTEPDYIYTIGERMAAKEVLAPGKFFNPHGTGLFIKA